MSSTIFARSSITSRGTAIFRQRFQRWIERRLLPARSHQLQQSNLFIFPSTAGLGFLFVNLLLWLTGTNYENNLVLATAFLQTSLFVVCIHHTFFNLAGLKLEVLHTYPGFAGDQAELELQLQRSPGRGKENIQLGIGRESLLVLDLIDDVDATVKLFVPVPHRGWCRPPRILVQSCFPLGLIRCWTWLAFDSPILVYPQPLPGGEVPLGSSQYAEGDVRIEQGAEDFHGFKVYQPGMPIRHLAWKQYARGQALYSKEYVTAEGQSQWLDWYALDGMATEARLSRLCYWVQRLGTVHQPLGLRLPGQVIEPDQGPEQQRKLLRALALFQVPTADSRRGAGG